MESTSMSTQIISQFSLSRLGELSTDGKTLDSPADFIEAARSFYRVVYLVAFAYTKESAASENIAVEAMAAAFKTSRGQQQRADELQCCLIRITLSEARRYLDRNAPPVVRNRREEIGDLIASQTMTRWRPIPSDATRDSALRGTLISAIQELSADTAVTLLLRDAFHFTPQQISALVEESLHKVQSRIAYARIALCMKLGKCVSNRNVAGEPSAAAAY